MPERDFFLYFLMETGMGEGFSIANHNHPFPLQGQLFYVQLWNIISGGNIEGILAGEDG